MLSDQTVGTLAKRLYWRAIRGRKICLTSRAMQLASQITLTASFTRPTTAVRGDVLHADYGPLCNITVRFV